METKPLLFGLVGFFIGGLLVSVVATQTQHTNAPSMDQMTAELEGKTGDNYDKAFIKHMIDHHEAALAMARLSAKQAKHQEIKDLSLTIISTQQQEINQMRSWQSAWGYSNSSPHDTH